MTEKVDPTLAPERIWLLLHEGDGGGHVWCDQPDPTGNGEHDAVEYVRADLAEKLGRAVLLFYKGGRWTEDDIASWQALTGQATATTKVLGDLARAVLAGV